ncbi:MAG TPA: thermonuclease family protein [Thermoanaerobaculia bacterium]|nr:thermonuclease family protein [Thermoanaerobaculia bacterium]
MRQRRLSTGILGILLCGAACLPALAGDSMYGRVTAVRNGEVVGFEPAGSGGDQLDLRLRGVEVAKDGAAAKQAVDFVSKLVLGKNARMRFEGRSEDGTMWCRLFTDDPVFGIKEVGVELVRAGLARRQQDFDFKYGELANAEREAQAARRGIWAADQPR